ncbi:rab-GTPase-TBC domain-containing protein [Sphaerosporella brunnea]|uniref:Rab-GTPase-TBC domain-containing protein n=1 Tax=Sphaerosporella brunnea TaxID=1250544 RepID=A0A5J5F6Y0_9PEZI|nr:rab-GTPase-TBC domain-containing protein [Sphaerosporella brunnea]
MRTIDDVRYSPHCPHFPQKTELRIGRKRWRAVFDGGHDTVEALKRERPCVEGLRSVCWRVFLLYADRELVPTAGWIETMRKERRAYEELHLTHVKGLEVEELLEGEVDPLAEDESNPYELYRRAEELRQEIFQDIERCMPENPFFRRPEVQKSLLEILFVYCKLNTDVSYRQGFHELAAVVYWVVAADAIEGDSPTPVLGGAEDTPEIDGDATMREVLDHRYIDHDAFSLFQCVMRSAKQWYELGEDMGGRKGDMGNSPIVLKSKYIHETLLMATDPELAEHLKMLDVLPQVFLIRWIRLLFGREFPFEELLAVWDVLFAEDPDLHLVDLICVAMLLRIRWKLLEADYSTALTLLLRYPAPDSPVSLVEDAMYLRDNLSPDGGKYIIVKYSKRAPQIRQPRPPAQKHRNTRRTMSPSMKPLFQPGQIESIVQDVAKNVLDRSEKWGVNRAVREAVVEVRKNVQGYQAQKQQQLPPSTREEVLEKQNADLTKRLQALEERRRQLARILDTSLGVLSNDAMGPAEKEDAMKRLTHVKDCLLDEQRPLDRDLLQPSSAASSPTSKSRRTSNARKPPAAAASPPGQFVKTSFKNNSDPDFISLAQRPRATLAQSSFAWMLGDDPVVKHRSAFVASGKSKNSSGALSRKCSERTLKTDAVENKGLGLLGDPEDEGFDLGSFRTSP